MSWSVLKGDCVEAMRAMDEASVDAVVCDPPYGLEFMGKGWDAFRADEPTSARHRGDRAGEHGRLEGGGYADGTRKAKVSYGGGGKRPSTQRCVECGKRDQFNQPHKPCGVGTWERVTLNPNAAPPSMLAFQTWCESWAAEALRVLKPGGHLLAFGGTRTYHRLACAIEDAGFEIRDCIAWLYGSGFPKSLDVSKAIDAQAPRVGMFQPFAAHYGEQRRACGLTHAAVCAAVGAHGAVNHGGASVNWEAGYNVPTRAQWRALAPLLGLSGEWLPLVERVEAEREKVGERGANLLAVAPGQGEDRSATTLDVTAPATPDAERWQGWGTALKPAHEPVVMARKPLAGTVAATVLATGCGALNIDACRIGTDDDLNGGAYSEGREPRAMQPGGRGLVNAQPGEFTQPAGRWPANVVLDPEAAAMLDEQTGELHSQDPATRFSENASGGHLFGLRGMSATYGDSGGASRFFYCAKASSAERNAGLDGFEAKFAPTMNDGIGGKEHSPPCVCEEAHGSGQGRGVDSPGRSMETSDGLSDGERSGRSVGEGDGREDRGETRCAECGGVIEGGRVASKRNVHPLEPTVKPIDLMRWLVRLVTPPGGRCLDPFAGSGTTGIACSLEGFDFLGIEREPEYAAIARARLAWWAKRGQVSTEAALRAGLGEDVIAASGQSAFDLLDGAA